MQKELPSGAYDSDDDEEVAPMEREPRAPDSGRYGHSASSARRQFEDSPSSSGSQRCVARPPRSLRLEALSLPIHLCWRSC